MTDLPRRRLYPKIQSVYKRDPANNHRTFLYGQWADPAFGYLANLTWTATEKVDGTNMRLHIDPDYFAIGGRSENAEIHPDLYSHIEKIGDRALKLDLDGLTLFGEGYGAGIQKGGSYREDKGFILFDVAVTETGMFLEAEDMSSIGLKLELPIVTEVWVGSLYEAADLYLRGGQLHSFLRDGEPEGWVIRPGRELRTRRGDRVITKLKVKDFPERGN